MQCYTCGLSVSTSAQYHIHNISSHTVEELSSTILKICKVDDPILVPVGLFNEAPHNNSKYPNVIGKNCAKKHIGNDGFSRECMDEIIELGPLEGADNLTVQSLFLKSNFAPNSRHIIEVEERKHSQDVMKILSKELNAAVVNFQSDLLSARLTDAQMPVQESIKNVQPDFLHVITDKKSEKRTRKRSSRIPRNENSHSVRHIDHEANASKNESTNSKTSSLEENVAKPNIKIVLRSGRTIKSNPKYEDFVYYDEIKDSSRKSECFNSVHHTSIDKSVVKRQIKSKSFAKSRNSPKGEEKKNSLDPLNSKMFDLFGDDLNLGDLNFSDELDISIEDLGFSGFDDFEGVLPENQILTIENLLQELEGGGSIEISNIIKENNIESDTVVLDALSQVGISDTLQEGNELKDKSYEKENTPCKVNLGVQNEVKKNYCTVCCKQYINRTHYLSHMEKYHIKCNKMLYKCATCEKVFYFLAAFNKHMKEHNPFQTFICELCGRNFKSLVNLKIHFALHKKDKTYQCEICSKKYFLKYSYVSHMKTHGSKTNFRCGQCSRQFSQKSFFIAHLEKHKTGKYLGRSNDYKCTYCNDLKTLDELSTVSKWNENFITCFKCKKGLYKKYLLTNVKYADTCTVRESKLEKKLCQICGKHVIKLQKHIREVHLPVPMSECDICGQTVKKTSLKAHKHRLHCGLPARCDHCDKMFKNSLALKEHLNKIRKCR